MRGRQNVRTRAAGRPSENTDSGRSDSTALRYTLVGELQAESLKRAPGASARARSTGESCMRCARGRSVSRRGGPAGARAVAQQRGRVCAQTALARAASAPLRG